MVAFATSTARSPPPVQTSYAAATVTGSLHHDTKTPNQDAYLVNTHSNLYAVLDGHGPSGERLASLAARTLLRNIGDHLAKLSPGSPGRRHHAALRAAFTATAEHVDSQPEAAVAGTTASVLVLDGDMAIFANVGDSGIVCCSAGVARLVTVCHRPDVPGEKRRVLDAGGIVQNGYVCDADPPKQMIAITRAFGDLDVRSVGVSSLPDITELQVKDCEFFILATDGLWDAHGGISPQQAVDVVRRCLAKGESLSDAVDDLMSLAKGIYRLPIDDASIVIVRPGSDGSCLMSKNCSTLPI